MARTRKTPVKNSKRNESAEEMLQAAIQEFNATRNDPNPPTKNALTKKYNVPYTTLSERIRGRLSKEESALLRTALTQEEEGALVEYLEKTALHGFPDTRARAK